MRTTGTAQAWSATSTTSHRSAPHTPPAGLCHQCMYVQEEQEGVEIGEGEEVYVEQDGGVVLGKVTEVSSQTQYEVAFEDGSVCSNLSSCDIVVSGGGTVCVSMTGTLSAHRTRPAHPHSRAPSCG